MADEFLTVTTYHDAVVPEWITEADEDDDDGWSSEQIRRAFREGVNAALNIECKGECASVSALRIVNSGDPEPGRHSLLTDSSGDTWRFQMDSDGDCGWRYADHMKCYPWRQVTRDWDEYFPMTRVD